MMKRYVFEHRMQGSSLSNLRRYRRGERSFHPHMMFNSEHAWLWHQKVKAFAGYYGIVDMEDFKKKCSPRWCYIFQDAILNTALLTGTIYPSLALAVEDSALSSDGRVFWRVSA